MERCVQVPGTLRHWLCAGADLYKLCISQLVVSAASLSVQVVLLSMSCTFEHLELQ